MNAITYNELEDALNTHMKRRGISSLADAEAAGINFTAMLRETGSAQKPFDFRNYIQNAPDDDYAMWMVTNFWEPQHKRRKGETEEHYNERFATALDEALAHREQIVKSIR